MTGRSETIEKPVGIPAAEFLERVRVARPGLARPHHAYYFASVFGGVDMKGARALDVGAGDGLYTAFLAAAGCDAVVALEPEGSGGRDGMNDTMSGLVQALSLENITLVPETFHAYCRHWDGRTFDLVLLQQSINHLDEGLVVDLHRDQAARRAYGRMIGDLRRLTRRGGSVMVTDCGRRNLFGDLGMTNPAMPAIEWEKHQGAELWTRLFTRHGFRRTRLVYSHPRLGGLGELLLDNRVASYLTLSHFQLRFEAV